MILQEIRDWNRLGAPRSSLSLTTCGHAVAAAELQANQSRKVSGRNQPLQPSQCQPSTGSHQWLTALSLPADKAAASWTAAAAPACHKTCNCCWQCLLSTQPVQGLGTDRCTVLAGQRLLATVGCSTGQPENRSRRQQQLPATQRGAAVAAVHAPSFTGQSSAGSIYAGPSVPPQQLPTSPDCPTLNSRPQVAQCSSGSRLGVLGRCASSLGKTAQQQQHYSTTCLGRAPPHDPLPQSAPAALAPHAAQPPTRPLWRPAWRRGRRFRTGTACPVRRMGEQAHIQT